MGEELRTSSLISVSHACLQTHDDGSTRVVEELERCLGLWCPVGTSVHVGGGGGFVAAYISNWSHALPALSCTEKVLLHSIGNGSTVRELLV